MTSLSDTLAAAAADERLKQESFTNIQAFLAGTTDPVAQQTVAELVEAGEWKELSDRFYKTLAFGTGGLRGRTIGAIVTRAEQGTGGLNDRPQHPCVGTATMNYYNLGRAVRGLIARTREKVGTGRKPVLVFAHDTRHFSQDFAEFCAKVSADHGCDVWLFDGPRSTPELSFAARELKADAAVEITASHNPAHDNGFKAYGPDGAQLVEPDATAVVTAVNAITSEHYEPVPANERGEIGRLGKEMDARYTALLKTLLLRPELLDKFKTRIVFTNLHGTGGHISVPLLRDLGFDVATVPEQDIQDGRFPTVESPNPENAAALHMAIAAAEHSGAEIIIGTDPDADRMGVAARDGSGKMELLTGNQIGSLMAWYRLKTMFELGWLTKTNCHNAVIIKTLVTTELQRAIANGFGVPVVDTLTGFKYIAEKLRHYEEKIPAAEKGDYRALDQTITRALRLKHSKFFVFGGEESYGYLGSDTVRDKDANGAALMFAEVAAYAKSTGVTVPELLDSIYHKYGYYLETGHSIEMKGAEGRVKIDKLAKSYSNRPPAKGSSVDGAAVIRVRDFETQDHKNEEGHPLPREQMLFVNLADGRAFAVRPSGTEPKIKYYIFGKAAVNNDLAAVKSRIKASLATLWAWLDNDAKERLQWPD